MWKPNDDKWGPTGIFNPDFKAKQLLVSADPDVRRNFNVIVRSLTGNQFSNKETERISREIIDNIGWDEADLFRKVVPSREGVLRLDARQWNVVKRLIGTFPEDDIGMRVRSAYDKAVKDQRIRPGVARNTR